MRVRTATAALLAMLVSSCATAGKPSELSASLSGTPPRPQPTSAPGVGTNWLRVDPQEGLRNARVALDVACLDNLGTVRSPVLDVGPLRPDPSGHQPWHLTGSATVRSDAAPGQYPISVSCGAATLTAAFNVVPHP